MKALFDILQILLSLPGALGFLASMLTVLLAWQLCKSVGEIAGAGASVLRWLRRRLLRLSLWRMGFIGIMAVPIFLSRFWVSDQIQYIEQVMSPAYETGDTSMHTLAIYEAMLDKQCDTYEAAIVKRRVREIASKIGSTPLAILEVAYSECELDPFRVRKDGVAAGFIQFTRAGAVGITTLQEVKDACRRRDIERMMNWTETYLIRAAAGRALPDATSVYVAVFAPACIGADDGRILYEGWGNPAYFENKIFDGYYTEPSGRIMRASDARDGKITIRELRLHLEAKKSRLLSAKKALANTL